MGNFYSSVVVLFCISFIGFAGPNKFKNTIKSHVFTGEFVVNNSLFNLPIYTLKPTPPKKYKHFLGEVFSDGVIFKLSKGKDGVEHGLVIALSESIPVSWQSTLALVKANGKVTGMSNTGLMTNSPAAIYVKTLGKEWYLPSIDELTKLYENRYYVQKALEKGKHTMVSLVRYWSSTEHDATFAYYLDFADGSASNYHKSGLYPVRGIKSF